ncbi:MAG: HI0074 family nucleotidyltransferase substrate-binding subunit [Prevotella sp.]|nr:HI0074 family nucleotidyltransferase substrate-binding subunit [Prevotella sp.]
MKKYENFCKALENLKIVKGFEKPYTIVSLAATVSLFTICFELSWKLIKEILEYHGYFTNVTGSPKLIIKSAYQCGMIEDESCWLDILATRNLLAHTYDEDEVEVALDKCKENYINAFEELKKTIDENWLNT